LSEHSRAFPARPNLRYLKIEAKRRLAAGEFATLHDAQLAIAREHGMPSCIRESSGQTGVAMPTRRVPIEPVNARLLRPVA